jgi:hypothetical protein
LAREDYVGGYQDKWSPYIRLSAKVANQEKIMYDFPGTDLHELLWYRFKYLKSLLIEAYV